jgi:hypothetical protein
MTGHFGTSGDICGSVPANCEYQTLCSGRLADAVKDQGNQLSVRTITRLERGTNFYARTTFTRVHSAISEGLAKSGKQSMSLEAIFPQLLSPSVARNAKKPSSAVPIIKTIESNS